MRRRFGRRWNRRGRTRGSASRGGVGTYGGDPLRLIIAVLTVLIVVIFILQRIG